MLARFDTASKFFESQLQFTIALLLSLLSKQSFSRQAKPTNRNGDDSGSTRPDMETVTTKFGARWKFALAQSQTTARIKCTQPTKQSTNKVGGPASQSTRRIQRAPPKIINAKQCSIDDQFFFDPGQNPGCQDCRSETDHGRAGVLRASRKPKMRLPTSTRNPKHPLAGRNPHHNCIDRYGQQTQPPSVRRKLLANKAGSEPL